MRAALPPGRAGRRQACGSAFSTTVDGSRCCFVAHGMHRAAAKPRRGAKICCPEKRRLAIPSLLAARWGVWQCLRCLQMQFSQGGAAQRGQGRPLLDGGTAVVLAVQGGFLQLVHTASTVPWTGDISAVQGRALPRPAPAGTLGGGTCAHGSLVGVAWHQECGMQAA